MQASKGDLIWESLSPVHFPDPSSSGGAPYVELTARTNLKDRVFLHLEENQELVTRTASDGTLAVVLRVYLKGPTTEATVSSVDAWGHVFQQSLKIEYSDWNNWVAWKKNEPTEVKRFDWNAGIGMTYLTYSDPAVSNFSEAALTPKVSAQYWLAPKKWELNANVYCAAIPIATSLNGVSASFLGANLRLGYVVPWPKDPWSLDLMAGFFYSTAFVTGSEFGYSNLFYPQLYPMLKRTLDNRDTLAVFLKIVPMEHGFSLGLAQRELATGIQWERKLANEHSLIMSLDFSSLSFIGDNTTIETNLTSYTLGVSYGF